MKDFSLGILTPVGEAFSGEVKELFARTTGGEIGILANHTDYLAGIVPCVVKLTDRDEKERYAFCGGGFISVVAGAVTMTVDEFVFAGEISIELVTAEKERLSAQLAACDEKREPERAQYLKTSLRRIEAKCKAAELR